MEIPYPVEATEFWKGWKNESSSKNSPNQIDGRNKNELA